MNAVAQTPVDFVSRTEAAWGAGPGVYRIGLVGTRGAGKTCLLAALGMLRRPNPRGCAADLLALGADAPPSVRAGHQWIEGAKTRLEQGKWPFANPNEEQQRSIRYRFTDGQARVKSVEVFDYSGELLNPQISETDLATRLRALLREMDGLIVLAEHPLPGRDNTALEQELNDMMRVVALLDSEAGGRGGHAARPIPVALVINKWDRSEHFQEDATWETQQEVLQRSFLQANPAPIHAAMRDKLRAVAQWHFEVFPVSACGATGAAAPEQGLRSVDLPPGAGTLRSFGLEDPFLWVIEQCDDLHLEETGQRLDTLSRRWWLPPWTVWGVIRRLGHWSRERIGRRTPEYPRLASLRLRAGRLVVWRSAIYVLALSITLLTLETGLDFLGHRRAEERLRDRGVNGGWRGGCRWLRAYGLSGPGRHFVYSKFFTKQAALDRAQGFESEEDEKEIAAIRAVCDQTDRNKIDTETARRLLKEHSNDFPNSPYAEECEQKLRTVETVVRTRQLRERLAGWRRDLEPVRKSGHDSNKDIELKLHKVSGFLGEVTRTQDLPAEGELRDQWNTLLNDLDLTRKELALALDARNLVEKIRQDIASEDYLGALDLFNSAEFRRAPDLALRDGFLQSLPATLQRKCDAMARGGESWEQADVYAGQFVSEGRADSLPATVQEAVKRTQAQIRQEGDRYLYELARQDHDSKSIDHYLHAAPVQSMASEMSAYSKWLRDRQVEKPLTFKLVEIHWKGIGGYWSGTTAVKLWVNGVADDRNDAEGVDKNPPELTKDTNGFRRVTVTAAQTQQVRIIFQALHVPSVWGKSEMLLDYHRVIKIETLAAKKDVEDDSAQTTLKFEVDGVIPEPPLPEWHPEQ